MKASVALPEHERPMLSCVHGDISSLEHPALDEWMNGQHWPVDEAAFQDLTTTIYAAYADLVASLPAPWSNLVLADVHFPHFIVQILHGRMVAERCEAAGHDLIVGDVSRPVFQPDFGALGADLARQLDVRSQIPAGLLRLRRQLLHNRHLSLLGRLWGLGRTATWSLGTETELKTLYAAHRNLCCAFPKPSELLAPDAISEPGAGLAAQNDVVDGLTAMLQAAIDCANLEKPSDELRQNLLAAWQRRLSSLFPLYQSVLSHRAIPETILLGNASNPLLRTVCLAAREKGARVVAFQHGHNLGFTDADIICFNDYAVCDEFVCATTRQIPLAQRRARLSTLTRDRAIQFVAMETDSYLRRRQDYKMAQNGPKERTAGPKRVMMIGSPLSANRNTTGVGDAYYHWLRLDILTARALKKAGHHVLYKAHPSSQAAADVLIAPEVDEMPAAPFEACCTTADVFVFGTPLTTTFGSALCTDIPIVMIDPKGRNWNRDIETSLRQRCEFVAARFDDHNQIDLDLDEFTAAIEAAQMRCSQDFFDTYLNPEPVAV
jgi:hypothetical protein